MRNRIADEAKKNNRSMNAEIVARLEASLGSKASLPGELESAVLGFAKETNRTFEDALIAAIAAGIDPKAPQVLIVRPEPGMQVSELRSLFDEAASHMHPHASVILEQPRRG